MDRWLPLPARRLYCVVGSQAPTHGKFVIRFDKAQISDATSHAVQSLMPVRFQDVDAAGIVYFARLFDYVHAAYEEFLTSAGHPLPKILADKQFAAPLRHAEADYLSPCRFGEVLVVELVVAYVEETEISLGFRVRGADGATRPKALVQTVHTFVTLPAFERCPVPSSIADALEDVSLPCS